MTLLIVFSVFVSLVSLVTSSPFKHIVVKSEDLWSDFFTALVKSQAQLEQCSLRLIISSIYDERMNSFVKTVVLKHQR